MTPVLHGDVELRTQTFGSPGDPPVVLVMGATASMLWWPESLCTALSRRGYFVIRYDNRDTGRSTSSPLGESAYAVEDMAEDLVAVIDGLDLPSAHVVGMSLGGLIGQIVALTHPERLRSLTVLGAEPLGWDGDPLPGIGAAFLDHFATMEALDWSDRVAVIAFMLEIARLSAGTREPFDAERERARIEAELDRATDIRSAFNHGALALRDDWSGKAAQIARPVLVLHGDEDPIAPPENGRAIANVIPGAQLHILRQVGHELPESAVPEIVGTLVDFLHGVERRSGG